MKTYVTRRSLGFVAFLFVCANGAFPFNNADRGDGPALHAQGWGDTGLGNRGLENRGLGTGTQGLDTQSLFTESLVRGSLVTESLEGESFQFQNLEPSGSTTASAGTRGSETRDPGTRRPETRRTEARDLESERQDGPRQVREFRGRTMGTTYMVKVAGADAIDDQTLRFSIDGELRQVNDQMSTYLKGSEITNFNESTETEWFPVSREFAEVVTLAQAISERTDGAFDVTVGPLVNLWSFGTTERTKEVPSPEAIANAKKRIGFRNLEVRLDPPALRKSIPELQIDLSSIAKGHGVDRVVAKLSELGAKDVFVEVGGEVRTSGDKPGGPWRVGIQLPDAAQDTVMIAHSMLMNEPAGNAMATSGDYRNVFVVDGKRYSHTIDPRTGQPIEHDLASVTVIATSCAEADGWATALNVIGSKDAAQLAADEQLSVLMVSRSGDESFELTGTGVLEPYAKAEPEKAAGMNWFAAVIPVAIVTFAIFSILLFAMAIGVIFGRRSISGSCGGLANKTNADGSTSCSLCSSPSDACRELREKMAGKEPEQEAGNLS